MSTATEPWSECNFDSSFNALYHIGCKNVLPRLPSSDQLSELGREFLFRCLTRNPDLRPSASELLKHEWINTLSDSLGSSNGSSTRNSANNNNSHNGSISGSAAIREIFEKMGHSPRNNNIQKQPFSPKTNNQIIDNNIQRGTHNQISSNHQQQYQQPTNNHQQPKQQTSAMLTPKRRQLSMSNIHPLPSIPQNTANNYNLLLSRQQLSWSNEKFKFFIPSQPNGQYSKCSTSSVFTPRQQIQFNIIKKRKGNYINLS